MVASVPEARCRQIALKAWGLLRKRQRLDGRWGFNIRTIGDGDSTAWGLSLAYALGCEAREGLDSARTVLGEHVRENGGVSTYATDGPIRRLIEAPEEMSFRGWCGAHTCVTAAVACLPEYTSETHEYLRRVQRSDGSWGAYWWSDREYSTALATEALFRSGQAADASLIRHSAEWAAGNIGKYGCVRTTDHPAGSPFATACDLRTLLLAQELPEARKAAQVATTWLFLRQFSDGSWHSSARLRVPWPDDDQPDDYTEWVYGGRKEGSLIFDQNRTFTTATVLAALHRARELELQ
jgi:squalene cyclase